MRRSEPMNRGIVILCLLAAMAGTTFAEKTICLDDDATGANDGSSWADAYNYLQDALSDADSSEKPVEIRVAQGTYTPDSDSAVPDGTGDRRATFELIRGVTLKGGYAGVVMPDLDANDVDVLHPWVLFDEPSRLENSHHVVESRWDCDQTSVLDGFIITGGYVDESGAGIFVQGSPTLSRCTFEGNCAGQGGGMYVAGHWADYGIAPKITECVFTCNVARYGGGAIASRDVALCVDRCRITENVAGEMGGGIFCMMAHLTITNSVISGNSVRDGDGWVSGGGGIAFTGCWWCVALLEGGILKVDNSVISGNADELAAGMLISLIRGAQIRNCTITGNLASEGGAAVLAEEYAGLTIENCIVWDNYPLGIADDDAGGIIAYNNIEGGWPGQSNIETDPCFVDEGYWDANGTPDDANDDIWVDGDYHLKSQGGRWQPIMEARVVDDVTSTCIDAGDSFSPIGLEPFPNGGIVNMGVYGGTANASKSHFGKPSCETIVAGDINGDCRVDYLDADLMFGNWLGDRPAEGSPGIATSPNPPDAAVDIGANPMLAWQAGSNAMWHEIYFGTTRPGLFWGSLCDARFYTNFLSGETTYYWRIDEVNAEGKTKGHVWQFTTGSDEPGR